MNKICTSLEQSKKLIKLGIDAGTADMFWHKKIDGTHELRVNDILLKLDTLAWSLAALLNLMPKEINVLGTIYSINIYTNNKKWFIDYKCNNEEFVGVYSSSLVDACYEMIVKLHDLNIL